MAKPMIVTVKADFDDSIDKLQELCNEISELSDLVPQWNRIEADKHIDNIEEILFDLIKTNGHN